MFPSATSAPPRRGVLARVQRADDRTLDWMSTARHGVAGPVLSVVARVTDLLGPAVAASGWLMARGTPRDRAAIRQGWRAMALAAVAESAIVKPATSRGRPDVQRLPVAQRRSSSPSTSAFPSGHVGGMTAFSVAVGRPLHGLRPWLAASTVMAAYARVYTGRHYLSDVLVGIALGAAAGALVSHAPSSA